MKPCCYCSLDIPSQRILFNGYPPSGIELASWIIIQSMDIILQGIFFLRENPLCVVMLSLLTLLMTDSTFPDAPLESKLNMLD